MRLEGVMYQLLGFSRTAVGDQIQLFIPDNLIDPTQNFRDGRSQSDLRGKEHPNTQSFCRKSISITPNFRVRDLVTVVARLLSVITLIFFTGCTPNAPYRDLNVHSDSSNFGGYIGGRPQQKSFYERTESDPYNLAFIEFDEKGDFWDREQLGYAYKQIEKLSRNSSKPPLLFIYIHGWQNNASDKTSDVANFRGLLSRLARNSQISSNYQVFGVYLGWRGLLVPGGTGPFSQALYFVPHESSFWSRKNTATRVAGEPMSEAIFAMVHAARKSSPRARTVLIGHSFGALVLEKTLAQALPASFYAQEDSGGGHSKVLPPADMILLLNSASESIYAKELSDMFRRAHFTGDISSRRPLILSITSEGDTATGNLFPIGTGLSNAFGTFREYQRTQKFDGAATRVNQSRFFTTTPGWNNELVSHRVECLNPQELKLVTNPNGNQAASASLDRAFNINLSHPNANLLTFCTEPEGHQIWWEIKPENNFKQTPYWIIKVPKEIIPDHTGIWFDSSLDMMAALYVITTDNQITSSPRTATMTAPK
jgi:hypothetical protein